MVSAIRALRTGGDAGAAAVAGSSATEAADVGIAGAGPVISAAAAWEGCASPATTPAVAAGSRTGVGPAACTRTSATPSTLARARSSSGSTSVARTTVNRESGSTSSSFSAGGSVDRTRACDDSRFRTSRAFMSASGRFDSNTTVTATRPDPSNGPAAEAGGGTGSIGRGGGGGGAGRGAAGDAGTRGRPRRPRR